MNYSIAFRKKAATEYIEAVAWYKERSIQAAENFVAIIQDTLIQIQNEPDYFRHSFKNFHEAKTKKYPFSTVYFVDEKKKRIVIASVFHNKRNPKRKFR